MLHAFIDESYIKGHVYLVTAVVATDAQVRSIHQRLDDVMWRTHRAHGVDPGTELHGQLLFQRVGIWKCFRDMPAAAHATYRSALAQVAASGARVFVRGVREDRLLKRYSDPLPPHSVALQHLLERINDYALSVGERVTVTADEVQDSAHHDERVASWAAWGTPGFKPSKLTEIDLPILWQPSHEDRCLQAADLASYIYLRKRFHPTTDSRLAQAVQQARDAIYPAMEHDWIWIP